VGAPAVSATAGAVLVQVRLPIALTSEQYITQQAWRGASLPYCPFGNDRCEAVGHGSYARLRPAGLRIARRYCERCGVTIGLVPDFASSRVSGTLDDFEEVSAAAEGSRSLWEAASQVRPFDGAFESAVKWVRFRAQTVRKLLRTAVGLVGELAGCEPRLGAVRERLGLSGGVLQKLRELCEPHLEALPAPVGLVPRPHGGRKRKGRPPQSTGPDPPSEDR
jgi:hypothetical protein